ncbi:MarR family winged helix-turn-helix transcriptional regulator [Marinicella sediminis]|uniref:MarR family winged helix-turn-helix transcriptional regulator n=1 Tax=Marinicella sediminis TaxID=1792834 RepID=A0ABV7J7T2_9GAMM|nr:MarR family transcriptional regulator [Marinicella sediminis]
MDKIDPQQTIFYSIEKAIKTYRQYAQKNLSARLPGITVDQLLILSLLEVNPEMAQKDLASWLFKDHASITRMIELLVKNEYLSRAVNPQDRRKFKLNISDKGHDTLQELKPIILNNRQDALAGISEKEIKELFITLNKIINNCQ